MSRISPSVILTGRPSEWGGVMRLVGRGIPPRMALAARSQIIDSGYAGTASSYCLSWLWRTMLLRGAYARVMLSTRRQGRHWKACMAGRLRMAGRVARYVIGRPHLEQIRTGGLSFAVQIIVEAGWRSPDNRPAPHSLHLGSITGGTIGIWREHGERRVAAALQDRRAESGSRCG